jgi:hypothetical protein
MNTTLDKTENDKVEIYKHKGYVFENGLLPLPDGESIATEPLPLPKEPPPTPKPMPHPPKNKHSEKEENPDKDRKKKEK